MIIISFTGKKGHGKSTACNKLVEMLGDRIVRVNFKDALIETMKEKVPGVLKDLTRMGARVVPAVNDIEPGIYTVAKFIAKRMTSDGQVSARLYVSPRCRHTIREFGHYRFKKERMGDKFSDDIEDKNNHAMDALRYALHTRFGGPSGRRNDYSSGDFTAG